MTRPSNFIPDSELTISPNSLISYMNELFMEIINDVLPYNVNIEEKNIKKSFKNKIKNSRIWQGILSSDRCMYIYTDNSKKCFTLCNKRILRNTKTNEPINEKENKYFCSNHIKGQDISIRKRKFKNPNIKYCCKNNKNGNPCGNTAILTGNICKEHYKLDRGIKKHEKILIPGFLYLKNNSIDFSSSYWYEYRKSIDDYTKETTTINNEVDSYYEKIISNFNTSENLFLKYLNPGYLARKSKDKEEILEHKKEQSFINISNVLNNIEKNNKNILDNENQDFILKKKKNISNYYLNNRFKRRKINCENIKDIFLNYNFSFKYSIMDYHIEHINKNNRKLLNKILIYIIDIRNFINQNNYYQNNKTYKYILEISDKILEII